MRDTVVRTIITSSMTAKVYDRETKELSEEKIVMYEPHTAKSFVRSVEREGKKKVMEVLEFVSESAAYQMPTEVFVKHATKIS